MIGAMPSGAARRGHRVSTICRQCAWATTAVLYAANRGNENNFGMRVNQIKLGGPGEEELLAEFCEHGEGDGHGTWPFGVAVGNNENVYVSDEWRNTISVFDRSGKFIRKFGETGSGRRRVLRPAGLACEKNGNLIVVDSGNNRLQVFTPEGKLSAQCGRPGSGDGQFNQPWGITLDKDGNIWVADWKNHRVQKLVAGGQVPDEDRRIWNGRRSPRSLSP